MKWIWDSKLIIAAFSQCCLFSCHKKNKETKKDVWKPTAMTFAYMNQSTAHRRATSSSGRLTDCRTISMVTKPADGIAAAPTAAATEVRLKNKHHVCFCTNRSDWIWSHARHAGYWKFSDHMIRKCPIHHMVRMTPNSVSLTSAKVNSKINILHLLHVHRANTETVKITWQHKQHDNQNNNVQSSRWENYYNNWFLQK